MDPDKTIKTTSGGKRAAAARDGRHAKATAETKPYALAPYAPCPERSHTLVVGGISIGEIHERTVGGGGSRYHAVIDCRKLPGILLQSGTSLMQGHGDTVDAALRDALENARRYIDEYTRAMVKAADMLGAT